jgi:hypothetical protein
VWDAKRLSCWRACIEQGSTPEIRERLKLHPVPAWRELARVAEYLRSKNLSDGEVSCFRNSLVCLYGELGLRPPTRYVYLQGLLGYFPNREEVFRQALAQSAQKYVVTDLVAGGIAFDEVQRFPSGERAFQLAGTVRQTENVYPWSLPIVFRAGRYAVHRVDRPIGRLQNEVPR